MMSTLTRKSLRELSRHRFRSALAVITVAATVMGIWLLAVPRGFDAAMSERVETDRLHHLRLSPANLYSIDPESPPEPGTKLDDAAIDALRGLDNVAAVEIRPAMHTQMRSGSRTQDIWLVGVEDFESQHVNIVSLADGVVPQPYRGDQLQALTDIANRATGKYTGGAGDEVEIMAGDREFYPFTVTGSGGTLGWSAAMDGPAHFFVPADTVRLFLGAAGFNSVEILLEDASTAAAAETLQEVKELMAAAAPSLSFNRIAETRDPGSWPGRENVVNLLPLLYLVVAMAVVAAVILLATTMNTIVREQTSEIGLLKALGASRRLIARSYVTTAVMLGGLGTILGTGAGIVVGNVMASAVQEKLLGFDPGWRVDLLLVAAGLALGLVGSVLATGPAIRRATRMTVYRALNGHAFSPSKPNPLGRIGRRSRFPSPLTALGLRNVGRRIGRSVSASAQVALGSAVALALGSFAVTAITVTNDTMAHEGSDIQVYATWGVLDPRVESVVERVDGVAAAQPIVYANVNLAGEDRAARGLPADPVYEPALTSGRWFTAREVDSAADVAILGEPIAAGMGLAVGDLVDIGLKDEVHVVEVVGIDGTLVNDGKYVLLPITTLMALAGYPAPTAYWVETVSPEPEVVDRAVDDIVSALAADDLAAEVVARYPDIEKAQSEDRIVVGVIQLMGLPILGIGMIGLVGAMASNIVERRREIGVLRSIGARTRHLRRIFRAEGLAVVLFAWAISLPVGYALAWSITREFSNALQIRIELLFPLWLPLVVLAGVIVVAVASMRIPIRRVVRMRPGDAIRYE